MMKKLKHGFFSIHRNDSIPNVSGNQQRKLSSRIPMPLNRQRPLRGVLKNGEIQ